MLKHTYSTASWVLFPDACVFSDYTFIISRREMNVLTVRIVQSSTHLDMLIYPTHSGNYCLATKFKVSIFVRFYLKRLKAYINDELSINYASITLLFALCK